MSLLSLIINKSAYTAGRTTKATSLVSADVASVVKSVAKAAKSGVVNSVSSVNREDIKAAYHAGQEVSVAKHSAKKEGKKTTLLLTMS